MRVVAQDDPPGPPAPTWFTAALANPPEHVDVDVDGVRVHLRCWGAQEDPGVVLIHGGAAHAGWWDHVAPLLALTHRVVAIELSGHGDSGRRAHYDISQWAAEVVAAMPAGGIAGRAVLVGHSMGGWVAVRAGVEHAKQVSGVVLIDSLLAEQAPLVAAPPPPRPTRVYPTREEPVLRFTTVPPQAVLLSYVLRHVAQQSLHRVEGGWTWKFDPTVVAGDPRMTTLLGALPCPAVLLRCEHGLLAPEEALREESLLPQRIQVVELADSGHHPMLDHPLQLVAAVRTLLSCWAAVDPS